MLISINVTLADVDLYMYEQMIVWVDCIGLD